MPSFMTFARDPEKRAIVSWLGGGLVVVIGALWTVVTFYLDHRPAGEKSGGATVERIQELEGALRAQKATLDELKVRFGSIDTTLIPANRNFADPHRQGWTADAQTAEILAAPVSGFNRLDEDIALQAARLQALQDSGQTSPDIDVETMKLKHVIDKRAQTFDALRGVIDRYNETAKNIIQSIGR